MRLVDEQVYCLQLIYALECIVDILDRNPVAYPLFVRDVVCLLEGRLIIDSNGDRHFINGLRE